MASLPSYAPEKVDFFVDLLAIDSRGIDPARASSPFDFRAGLLQVHENEIYAGIITSQSL